MKTKKLVEKSGLKEVFIAKKIKERMVDVSRALNHKDKYRVNRNKLVRKKIAEFVNKWINWGA